MRDIHAYDYNGGYYAAEIVSDLLNLKCVTDVTEEKQVVSVEIDTEKDVYKRQIKMRLKNIIEEGLLDPLLF